MVVALTALFVALGGSSYAVLKINGSQIENRSISGKKLKRNTLGGATIKESRLGKVRRARRADRLGRFSASELRLHAQATRRSSPVYALSARRMPRPRMGLRASNAIRSGDDCPRMRNWRLS
jgi:hypothetical protein